MHRDWSVGRGRIRSCERKIEMRSQCHFVAISHSSRDFNTLRFSPTIIDCLLNHQPLSLALLPQLLPDDIRTAFLAHPDFMPSISIYIDSRPRAESFLLRFFIVGIKHGELASEDQMCGYSRVGMRGIMGIPGRSQCFVSLYLCVCLVALVQVTRAALL